jgi:hypothetical protein
MPRLAHHLYPVDGLISCQEYIVVFNTTNICSTLFELLSSHSFLNSFVRLFARTHSHTHTHTHSLSLSLSLVLTLTHIHMHIYTYTHIYIHTYMRVCMCVHACVHNFWDWRVPFRTYSYAPFPVLLPFFKCILEIVFCEADQHCL